MERYELGAAERAAIFERRILRRFLHDEEGIKLPDKPELIILGGQPGSGKTGVLSTSQKELQRKGATWTINADDFASFVPAYDDLQKIHGAEAADMVRGITSDWIQKTVQAAQTRGVNVVFESTMRQPEVVKRTLADFRGHGYQTHAKMLAVNPMVSWQGNHLRREYLAAKGSHTRLATREAHDAGVRGSGATVDMIERERLADRLTIVSRAGQVLHTNELHDGRWKKHAQAAECLQAHRAKPLTVDQARHHDATWSKILEMAQRRHQLSHVAGDVASKELAAIRADRAADAAANHLQRVGKTTGARLAPEKGKRDEGRDR